MNDLDAVAELGPVLVVIPTYNEAPNIARIVARLRSSLPGGHALIVDDTSPDGTGDIADKLALDDPHVHVLHRAAKTGLGEAYIAGFRWGMAQEFAVLVEMDADGSHLPEELPGLLSALTDADLVIGSRYAPGGRVVNWPRRRELLSRGGNLYAQVALGLPLRDATGGFRAFRGSLLKEVDLDRVASHGYCFQIDLACRAVRLGARVVEVPITFVERELGESKMDGAIVREALWRVTQWGAENRLRQLRTSLSRPRGRDGGAT